MRKFVDNEEPVPALLGGRAAALRVVIGLGVAAVVLLALFRLAEWCTDGDLLRRYCDDPVGHVARVGEILRQREPAGDGARRPYAVAAKLIFAVPQGAKESVEAYLERLRRRVHEVCG